MSTESTEAAAKVMQETSTAEKVEKTRQVEELAEKLWERDAKHAGLGGCSINQAVIAAMTDQRLTTLPDPLAYPSGALLNPDSWVQHGVDAGLWMACCIS